MNGISSKLDLNPLIGQTARQICFGEFQLIVRFDDPFEIGIECDCSYENRGLTTVQAADYGRNASLICNLLGKKIHSAERTSEGGLLLYFEGDTSLHVINSNRHYESFQIHLPSGTYTA